jgi:hypothetical protein
MSRPSPVTSPTRRGWSWPRWRPIAPPRPRNWTLLSRPSGTRPARRLGNGSRGYRALAGAQMVCRAHAFMQHPHSPCACSGRRVSSLKKVTRMRLQSGRPRTDSRIAAHTEQADHTGAEQHIECCGTQSDEGCRMMTLSAGARFVSRPDRPQCGSVTQRRSVQHIPLALYRPPMQLLAEGEWCRDRRVARAHVARCASRRSLAFVARARLISLFPIGARLPVLIAARAAERAIAMPRRLAVGGVVLAEQSFHASRQDPLSLSKSSSVRALPASGASRRAPRWRARWIGS